MKTVEQLFEGRWSGFHDAVVEALDVQPTKQRAIELFKQLPEHIQIKAFQWGLRDTEVRDESYVAIKELGLKINTGE